jgi:hypothetical protein
MKQAGSSSVLTNHSLWLWVPDQRSASLRLSGTTLCIDADTHRATDSFSAIALRRIRDSDSTEYGFWISSNPRCALSASTLL